MFCEPLSTLLADTELLTVVAGVWGILLIWLPNLGSWKPLQKLLASMLLALALPCGAFLIGTVKAEGFSCWLLDWASFVPFFWSAVKAVAVLLATSTGALAVKSRKTHVPMSDLLK